MLLKDVLQLIGDAHRINVYSGRRTIYGGLKSGVNIPTDVEVTRIQGYTTKQGNTVRITVKEDIK